MLMELHKKPAFGGKKAADFISLNESSVVIGCAALSFLGQAICDNIPGSKVSNFRNRTSVKSTLVLQATRISARHVFIFFFQGSNKKLGQLELFVLHIQKSCDS